MSPKQKSILEALATYKFLSRLQMARLGIENYNTAFSKYSKSLIEANYVGVIDAINYGIGHIYYLKRKGAIFLSKGSSIELDSINYCHNIPQLSVQTLFHRTGAINCQIELSLECQEKDIEILFYDRDFEMLGNIKRENNLSRKTRVPLSNSTFLEPDAVFMLQTSKGNKLYCLEFENKDITKKSFQKVRKHVHALNLKSPSTKYGHNKGHRTLFIYKNEATMQSVIKKTKTEIESIRSWFLFKSYDEVLRKDQFKKSRYHLLNKKNFFEGWLNSKGESLHMF